MTSSIRHTNIEKNMRFIQQSILTLCGLSTILILSAIDARSQQSVMTEKQDLVMKFRKLTGADNVNLTLNVSFEDVKSDLIATVDAEGALTDSQRSELRKSAVEAYDRLDTQLKEFLNDKPQITKLSEAAVFQVYDQAFSDAELRELIAFYSTGTGQKALQFLPTLPTQVQKAFQSVLIPKVQEFIAPRIKDETEKLKTQIQATKSGKPE